ncbi:MAG TPA: zinc ribbon domain-containing protein, partial [Ktedonobacterales bacterium]|nr:zinc ribbon domain-containing protein [Ktedonobacterales bacterium]
MSVRCSQGHENPDGSAFCDECGEPLAAPAPTFSAPIPAAPPVMDATITCPSCGSANPAGESFCSNCGANLNAPPPVQPAPVAAPAASFAPAPAAVATRAQIVVESDNTVFDLAGKSEALIGREDAVSNIFPDIDLTPHNGEDGGVGR